jgi:predicted small metal-binding protein
MRALLCAPLCNCRHSLRADDEEALVEVALEHMRHHHPYASVEEERIRETVCTRSYYIEYVVAYEGAMGRRRRRS